MQPRKLRFLVLVSLAMIPLVLLTACGSSGSKTQPLTPVFTSVPGMAATQDVAYTYPLAATDPAGGSVTFSLTTSPTGAALSGNTVTWIPTAAQSRVSNSFTVKAATTSGGTASQSWMVTPGGTITVNWVNTHWTATGPVQVPAQASVATILSAMWTNPDGSITVEKSSATSPGVFSVPNVPGGYYWLNIGGNAYWTSTGTFDAGSDFAGPAEPLDHDTQLTKFSFSLTGLDSTIGVPTWVLFLVPVQGVPGFSLQDPANSDSIAPGFIGFGTAGIDWTQINSAFLLQYKPVTLSSSTTQINNQALDYSVDASLSLVDDTNNLIMGTLQQAPQESVSLSVSGSQWASLFTHAAPADPTPFSSALAISAEPYLTGGSLASVPTGPEPGALVAGTIIPPMVLAGTTYVPPPPMGIGFTIGGPVFAGCDGLGFSTPNSSPSQPAITTDQNFGALPYGDPFPSAWTRQVSLCQEYSVPIPTNATATANFVLVDRASIAPPSTPPLPALAPVVSQVQNPTINGASLFTALTLNSTVVPLSWAAPTGAAPYGYTIRVYILTTVEGVQTYAATGATFSTAHTSISLPPLAGGNTYVVAITADADGTAKMETGPFRSSLPTGTATVVSAPMTINSGAQTPAIHGDRRVITRFSQPQPQRAAH